VSHKALPIVLVMLMVTGFLALANQRMGGAELPKSDLLSIATKAPADKGRPLAATGQVAPLEQNEQQLLEPSRRLALPDGTFVDSLNDTVDAPPLTDYWGPFDWSPIIGIERSSADVDWYKHADGSYSTTQMVWRSDLGRDAAMTRVAHPGPDPATTAPAATTPTK